LNNATISLTMSMQLNVWYKVYNIDKNHPLKNAQIFMLFTIKQLHIKSSVY